jgi:hypothetical protein
MVNVIDVSGICMADGSGLSTNFSAFLSGMVVPLCAYAAIATSLLIGAAYMFGTATANARLTTWSKTEIIQLFISLATIFFIIIIMNTMCSVNMQEVAAMFGTPSQPQAYTNVYAAAEDYLNESALYTHDALTVVRYHLEGYTILAYMNAFACEDFGTGVGWGCLFGYSGDNLQPLGGYGALSGALSIFFNALLIAMFTVLNYIFILMFVYSGFVFLFLPMGVFLRAMPYMRSFGALLIALALSFLIIYPLVLGIFYLMGSPGDILLSPPPGLPPVASYDESIYPQQAGGTIAGQLTQAAFTVSADQVKDRYFEPNGANLEDPVGAIEFASDAFIAAVFLPTVALLATIATVAYLARLYGEEIDLSRLTQLV